MKKGVRILFLVLSWAFFISLTSAFTVQNHHCDSMGLTTVTVVEPGSCPSANFCSVEKL